MVLQFLMLSNPVNLMLYILLLNKSDLYCLPTIGKCIWIDFSKTMLRSVSSNKQFSMIINWEGDVIALQALIFKPQNQTKEREREGEREIVRGSLVYIDLSLSPSLSPLSLFSLSKFIFCSFHEANFVV